MTPEQLREIEQRWEKATMGPWYSHYGEYDDGEQGPQWNGEMEIWPKRADRSRRSDVLNLPIAIVGYHGSGESDAAAIASAPTDITLLLAEVRRLQCCGNCRQQEGNPYFECAYMDVESYNESGCKRCSEWEAADNG